MKSWYLLPAFASGILLGLVGHGDRAASTSPAPASPTVKSSLRESNHRPDPGRDPKQDQIPLDAPPAKRAEAFREWIAGLNASNWRERFQQANSREARDARFLHDPSVESLSFLRRLGEVAPQDALQHLIDIRFDTCIPEVAEGWARVDPHAAFAWTMDRYSNGVGWEAKTAGRAASVLLAEDPAAVLKHPKFYFGNDLIAFELNRHMQRKDLAAVLQAHWEDPGDDHLAGERYNEFQTWQQVLETSFIESHRDPIERAKAQLEHFDSYLQIPNLNPKIRFEIGRRTSQLQKRLEAPPPQ